MEALVDEANEKLEAAGSPTIKKEESLGKLRSSSIRKAPVEQVDGEAQTDIGLDYFEKIEDALNKVDPGLAKEIEKESAR